MSRLPPSMARRARVARAAAGSAAHAGRRAAVPRPRGGGARRAPAAARAGPALDRLDDAGVPASARLLAAGAERAAAASRAATGLLLRAATRARLLVPAAGEAATATPDAGATAAAGTGAPGGGRPVWAGRAVLERGARVVVLGLVALIVLGATASLLPGFNEQLRPVSGPSSSAVGGQPAPAEEPAPAAPGGDEPGITVGPYPGDSPEQYAATADQVLRQLAEAAPDADLLAVVSLRDYRSPADLHAMLATYRLTEVFYAVPAAGQVHAADVRDPVADVLAAFDASAADAAARAAAATDPVDRTNAETEAAALGSRCACLFAAVVRAPAARLLELRTRPEVRVVDPAPPGTVPGSATFVPLLPETP
ncbi:MAG: hypothetical protein IRZ08_12100 [Frankia sp.]|nr:hypothetical protein [Frankia sp.]